MTSLAPAAEARWQAMRAADALMEAHPGAVVTLAELRGDRYGLWAHVPGAWRLGDVDEIRAWLEAEAPAMAAAQGRP